MGKVLSAAADDGCTNNVVLHADAQFGSMSSCSLHHSNCHAQHSNHYTTYYSSIMSLEKVNPTILRLYQHNWDKPTIVHSRSVDPRKLCVGVKYYIVHMYSMPYYTYGSTTNFLVLGPTALLYISKAACFKWRLVRSLARSLEQRLLLDLSVMGPVRLIICPLPVL